MTTVVSLVRWLKANQIPADIEWAQQHQVNAADTPAKMAVLVVLPATEKGKPIFRSRVEKK